MERQSDAERKMGRRELLRRIYGKPPTPPSAAVRLLTPESWAPAIAKKLRSGEALEKWEREAAAKVLDALTAQPRSPRGRKPFPRFSPHPQHFDETMYEAVLTRHSMFREKLIRGGAFKEVARLFTMTNYPLTPKIVEDAYRREKKRRR
jgi:hypothetical protein